MLMKKKWQRTALIFVLLSLLSCAPRKKVPFTPEQIAEFNSKIKESQALLNRGSYSCLEKAFNIFEELLDLPPYQKLARENLVKTAILLCLRENELGVINDEYFTTAWEHVRTFPYLSQYSSCLEFVQASSTRTRGKLANPLEIQSDIENFFNWLRTNANSFASQLREKAESDEFSAYIYISLYSEFHYHINNKDDLSRLLKIFPDSPLIFYKLAISQEINTRSLRELIIKEPSFYEAYFFLGKTDLMFGKILTAENNLLRAYEHFPSSISLMNSLSKVYFALEELEKCLEYNQKILQLSPDYRDALLGKAICLSYLGQSEEAIKVLNRILELSTYLMGETYYWLAWNRNELEYYQQAWEDIENAKKYLIGHHEVFTLSGIIAFAMGHWEDSKKEFMEAIRLGSPDCDPFYYLGKLYVSWEDWKQSALYFEKAAQCHEGQEVALIEKIRELESSSLSEERKRKLTARKENQLRKTRLIKATCFYNAAAGYFNSGMMEKAIEQSQKTSLHKALQQRAQELIERIKKDKKLKGN
jgi:tetratricopeptide (TPR) repeat protein